MSNRRNFIKGAAASIAAALFALRNPEVVEAASIPGLAIPIVSYGRRPILDVYSGGASHAQLVYNGMLAFSNLKVGDERIASFPYYNRVGSGAGQLRYLTAIVFRTSTDLIVHPIRKVGENPANPWYTDYLLSEIIADYPGLQR
jgi:hypothetical protein